MLIHHGKNGYLDIPLRDWAQVFLEKTSEASNGFEDRQKSSDFLKQFNVMDLSQQLRLLQARRTKAALEVLAFNNHIKPNALARVGESHRTERSCELSSSSYLNFNWSYFILDEKGIYLMANLDTSSEGLYFRPYIATRGHVHVRNHGILAPMMPMNGFYDLEEGDVSLGGFIEGYVNKMANNRAPYTPPTNLQMNLRGYSKRDRVLKILRTEIRKRESVK